MKLIFFSNSDYPLKRPEKTQYLYKKSLQWRKMMGGYNQSWVNRFFVQLYALKHFDIFVTMGPKCWLHAVS